MAKIEVVVTMTATPCENLIDMMGSAAQRLIHPGVDKVIILHNGKKYTITKEKAND